MGEKNAYKFFLTGGSSRTGGTVGGCVVRAWASAKTLSDIINQVRVAIIIFSDVFRQNQRLIMILIDHIKKRL